MTGRLVVPGPVVLAGDSITEWGRRDDPADLGSGYVRLLAEGPLAGVRVVNAGVGGDRVADLAARWDRDVLAERPAVVSVDVGVNDTWRRFDAGEETTAEQFAATYRALLVPLAGSGVRLVLVEPFVVPVDDAQRAWADDLAGKQQAVRALADEAGAAFVALAEPAAALAAHVGAAAVAADGVHPTALGHRLIADAWWSAYAARHAP
jgi:lysophospholipase L1-like esterase